MNNVERFENALALKGVDRLPAIEWAPWWDVTLARWYGEGLPRDLVNVRQIAEYLGLDSYCRFKITARSAALPKPPRYGAPLMHDDDEYRELKPFLYPQPGFDMPRLQALADRQRAGLTVVSIALDGFFWFPRILFGIEPHLYAFYDQPELMHAINGDLLAYNLRVIDQVCEVLRPSFVALNEDMSFNLGPMISKDCFDRFLAPYYRQIVPHIRRRGSVPVIDSDGDVTQMVSWFESVGIQGVLPLERMAGVDVARIRRDHPRFVLLGAFDKTIMHLGEGAMRREFERLLPVMVQGGFIPGVDHQTPPDVSLAQYRCYVSLLREYCQKAAEQKEGGWYGGGGDEG
jgi:hypothetical protein